ncbi:MAG: methylenetetrahydrofolate reductase [Chloroflexaceae bacterium]|nr:methylenetetrahydrofolate reductase [Chloroflexaceae bacterium]NJL33037.1 methylenetetrahydrofolate reductase [Chloroflexaceae bacterium]NJO06846.1 methylenetetrahydrofolate reductase [Chloroflexaceae bacterium]
MYSMLHRRLAAGQPVVTGEIAPPKGADRGHVEKLVRGLQGTVDAINFTDNQRGIARMSALGAAIIARQMGAEPIVQITCQNRNRLAIQADVLSAAALGIAHFLCMTGDHPRNGDHPLCKNVLDLNSFKLLQMLRTMRDRQTFDTGGELKGAPRFLVGGVANPNIEKVERLEKKIEAGAEFIQTQIIFDTERFRTWMHDVRAAGLHQQASILAGVMIPRSVKSVHYLKDTLPGMSIPDPIVERMQRASDEEHEGVVLAAEIVKELLSIEGVAGVHLMSVGWTRSMPHVVEHAGLLPRPEVPVPPDTLDV